VTSINTPGTSDKVSESVRFRWTYIALPAAVLVIAVIIAAVFYSRLPAETAYRFSGGLPVSWVSRGGFTAWAIGLQLVFALLSLAVTLFIITAVRRLQLAESRLNRTLFAIIGNIMALPQIIAVYATLHILLYNIYEKALPPLWIFAVAVMAAGGIILAVFFARAIAQSNKLKTKNITGSKSDVRE
jgi:uncharacterized membrane protein